MKACSARRSVSSLEKLVVPIIRRRSCTLLVRLLVGREGKVPCARSRRSRRTVKMLASLLVLREGEGKTDLAIAIAVGGGTSSCGGFLGRHCELEEGLLGRCWEL